MTLTGKRVSHYQILSKIGEGGMATVYLAEDEKHGRRVALKVMNSNLSASDRFLREIEIAARLTHPHILPLHDSGVIEGQPYYVMPYIEGESLRQRIIRLKVFSIDDALRFAKEIASALGYAHQQGLIHRDIKPENVLLSNGIALVADFGIARFSIANEKDAITMANSVIGTPAYMSPEQVQPGDSIDGRADLYSLGCVLYEMLVGAPPFTGPLHSLPYQHISVEPRSISENRPEVPAFVAEAVHTLLAKNPEGRYRTAADFVNAITTEAATVSFETSKPHEISSNLPKDRTRFIGRTQELLECVELLNNSRLLTLAGLGGCGKTRLAIKVAENLTEKFPAGVWFVDLAPLTEASRVVGAVAQVLGLREEAGKDLNEVLTNYLAEKKLLLVIDNCEHLLSSCAEFVDGLLNSSDRVRIIATSREALNVQGERVLHLPPLGTPDTKANFSFANVQTAEAIQLFVDRAQIVRPSFELTIANASSVAEVCRRLDGIPLAIELAAARMKILSVEQILTKLDDRFKLLSSVGRTMLPRHQTLRAVIEWSYDQLAAEEQKLLRALSVFAGGWTLGLAATVVTDMDEFEILELHSQLVDKSIIVVSDDEDATRYSLLETVRQFLFERLEEKKEAEQVRKAHFNAMLELAERAYAARATEEERWTTELEIESDNMRVALEYARSVNIEEYLSLVGALAWFWIIKTHLVEGRAHLTAALELSTIEPSRPSRARALWGAAHMLALQGETAEARAWIDEARAMSQELGDTREIAIALEGIGWMHFFRSEDDDGCRAFEECLRLQQANGDQRLIIRAKVGLAQELVALGRTDEAKPIAREIIEFAEAHNDKRSEHFGWHYLADCELILGNCSKSLSLYKKSLALANAIGDKIEISFEVQGVAMSLAGFDQTLSPSALHQAIQLESAVKAEWDRLGADIHVRFWDELLDRYLGAARRLLTRDEFEREWNKGQEMSFEDAVTLALEVGGTQ